MNLKIDLIQNEDMVLPPNFHERTGHRINLEKNLLQRDLDEFQAFTESRHFKVNVKKSTVILFNRGLKFFLSEMPFA